MPKLRYGHAPGHVRDTACDAFEAWLKWHGSLPEPTVKHEINYMPQQIPISRACGLVWNCSDIVPGDLFDRLQYAAQSELREGAIRMRTYAACARYILADIKASLAKAA
ncbi:hypothetical protein [Bradyrhizobium liaoningense]